MIALKSVLPILIALALGYLSRWYFLPKKAVPRLIGAIGPLVRVLLFLIGSEFAEVTSSLQAVGYVLKMSSLVAVVTTALPCLLLMGLPLLGGKAPDTAAKKPPSQPLNWQAAAAPLKECFIALSMVALGVLFYYAESAVGGLWLPSSHLMLLLLIFLVGIDLSTARIGRNWITWPVLLVPAAVIAGSILGAYMIYLGTGADIRLLLALSSGFGWFSLSSVLIGSLSGDIHGATALLTDLERELIAITLLYLMGRQHPKIGIAAAGATALDSTLPIVRQACHVDALPIALMSGFILTILAPFFITFFLTL